MDQTVINAACILARSKYNDRAPLLQIDAKKMAYLGILIRTTDKIQAHKRAAGVLMV